MPSAAARTPRPTSRAGLRPWQALALERMAGWEAGPFLISAAPGAGKTRPSLVLARELLKAGAVKRVAVICPTTPLTRQWAAAAAEQGVHLVPDAEELTPPKDFQGVSVTYARVASVAEKWARQCSPGTLVIADEAHHLGDELAWGVGFSKAFAAAQRKLLLSGTPFRSDATPIPGVTYDDEGVAVPDVSYTYADAVRDGVCRPVTFIPYDGTLQWRSGDDLIEAGFDTVLTGREASRRYRTAISTELPDGLPRILGEAHKRLLGIRADGHKDAGGLVVAADSTHARAVASLLKQVTGKAPTVVLHTEQQAARKLAAFTHARDEWIVAVNMVSEGVDIPRLRVGVYASAAKTPLVFRQIVGRFVRTIAGRPADMSWLYLPADPVLRTHANEVEGELRVIRRPREDDEDPMGLDELRERRETERSETPEFVPLAADVAPTSQMSLFGGAPAITSTVPAPAPAPVVFASAVPSAVQGDAEEADDDVDPGGLPAFQRRALLREKRHGLVGDLRRRDGRSPREINAWLNRETGVTRVEDATIEQLQRSIDLLLDALTARR
ncbi:DEAD/DEAH box helicase [Conexibacter sp. SYSU D00693]|uniref:DEAD/DEAH box helicase n=1 Tax=Conexibacter sp. SYSU D00693 TaxID=2812560 RepID=UPI00196A7BE7|nr:DEAD/DEAH box helicase family protein [Conexibacter sp. SYSU D00693]